jgi:hypothetical protein
MTKSSTKGIGISVDGGPVGQAKSIGALGKSYDLSETTDLGDAMKTFMAVIGEGDELTVQAYYDPDMHDDLTDAADEQLDDGEPVPVVVSFPDPINKTRSFDAAIKKWSHPTFEPGGVVMVEYVFKPSGEWSAS